MLIDITLAALAGLIVAVIVIFLLTGGGR